MKVLKFLLIISPVLLIILYFELLNIDSYYKDTVSVGEIIIKESKASPKVKAIRLNEIYQQGLEIMRTKLVVEILMIAVVLFIVIMSILYFKKYLNGQKKVNQL